MKRFFVLLVALMLVLSSVIPVFAANSVSSTTPNIIYYNDGSYTTISDVYVTDSIATRTSYLKFGSRKVTHYGSGDEIEWEYVLSATFSYEPGVSSTCIEASYDQTIYDDAWTFSNGSATKSGNTAYGAGLYIKKVLFINVLEEEIDIDITCDSNGNLS